MVANKDLHKIRVMNLSLSADPSTPYFIDPINRAVEAAWANDIVVVAAAGNTGPGSSTVTVPGNDPYVITVGAIDNNRTPGYWADDMLPSWAASGPTLDGFAKPDVVAPGANIISFMYNDQKHPENAAKLAQDHPDYSPSSHLFRMHGTSMATGLTSGIVALMLQAHPELTPNQVKYRLMYTAQQALTDDNEPLYNIFQQGMGRVWAPAAVLSEEIPTDGVANPGMDIQSDLAHNCCSSWVDLDSDGVVEEGEIDQTELGWHYQGAVRHAALRDENHEIVATFST